MFKKYEKTYRVKVPQFDIAGKLVAQDDEVRAILNGNVIIEEKLDGANAGIIRHKSGFSLQKRGSLVGQSEHAQFQFFHSWSNRDAYDRIMSVPEGILIYGELMFAVHTIYYDKLPDWFIVFDVLNVKTNKWMNRSERDVFCERHGFSQVPLIASGNFLKTELSSLIPDISAYGPDPAEGIVIKRYTKKEYNRIKLVKPEFVKRLNDEDEHWSHKELKRNVLNA